MHQKDVDIFRFHVHNYRKGYQSSDVDVKC